jgi:hypothetical protein
MSKPSDGLALLLLQVMMRQFGVRSMAKFIRVLFCIFVGITIGAFTAGMLVSVLSDNIHDKSLEIANTAAFFGAPIGAVLGLIAGFLWKVPVKEAEPKS